MQSTVLAAGGDMEVLISALVGLGLAASCGFRVFVPLWVAAVASQAGWVVLHPDMAWLGSWGALAVLTVATGLELGAYLIPWVDNALDLVASPAAVVAGTLVSASFLVQVDPVLQWSAAAIAGGGLALGVQAATVSVRAASSTLTGGLGNSVVALLEAGAALLVAVLALVVPALAVAGVVVLLLWAWRQVRPLTRASE